MDLDIYMHNYTHISTYECIYTYINMHICIYMYAYIYIHINIYIYIYVRTVSTFFSRFLFSYRACPRRPPSAHEHIYIYIYIYTHTYTDTDTPKHLYHIYRHIYRHIYIYAYIRIVSTTFSVFFCGACPRRPRSRRTSIYIYI